MPRRYCLLSLLALTPAFAPDVLAQAYPCGAGPGLGEVQVGVSGGSHGIAPTPMCVPSGGSGGGSGGYAASAPPPEVPVDNYVAVAGRPGYSDVWATLGQYRLEAAERVVMDACTQTLGEGCQILMSGKNMTIATARDRKGEMHVASGADGKAAKRAVTAVCESRGERCKPDKYFHAQQRAEALFASAILHDDNDVSGLFKKYYFPPDSKIPAPRYGEPDAGVLERVINSTLPDVPGIRKVHFSAHGSWLLREGDSNGLGCSLIYARDDQRVIFIGPTANQANGALMLDSTALPPLTEPREAKASMSGDRGTVEVRIFLFPNGESQPAVMMLPTDMTATLASMSDHSPLTLVLDGKTVIELTIDGGHKAKAAMQQCMRGT